MINDYTRIIDVINNKLLKFKEESEKLDRQFTLETFKDLKSKQIDQCILEIESSENITYGAGRFIIDPIGNNRMDIVIELYFDNGLSKKDSLLQYEFPERNVRMSFYFNEETIHEINNHGRYIFQIDHPNA